MSAIAPVAALLLSVAFLLMGNGLQNTLLPVRGQLENFGPVEIASLGSAYFLGFALGALLGPHTIQRVGHIRVFLVMSAIASAVPLLHVLALNPWFWTLLRIAAGFCLATLYIVIESWLNELSTNENRGKVLSTYMFVNLTVIMLGQLMLALYDPRGFELFVLAAVLVSVAALPVGLTRAPTPAAPQSVRVRPRHLYAISPIGFLGCLAVGLSNGSFWALGPLFADRAGMDVTGIALFMSAAVLGGALGQWPIGRLSDRFDRRRVIIGLCLGAAGVGVALAGIGERLEVAWLLALVGVFGFFAFPLYGVSVAHTNDFVDPAAFVEASGGLLLVFAAGAIIGPMLTGLAIKVTGSGGLFVVTAATHFLLMAAAVWRISRRARPAPERRVHFMEALPSAVTVSTTFEEAQVQAHDDDPAHPAPSGR